MSDWIIQGTDQTGPIGPSNDPALRIYIGDAIRIQNNAGSFHPMYFKTVAGSGTGNQISGVINQGAYNGQEIKWTANQTGTFYYQCSNHGSMSGQIIVSALPAITPTPITGLSTPAPYYIYPTPTPEFIFV